MRQYTVPVSRKEQTMARCPKCHSQDVITQQHKEEIDQNQVSRLVLRSWLTPGGILKNRKQYRTETTCTCRQCGYTWQPRSKTEIGMAVIGAVILICFILLGIFSK